MLLLEKNPNRINQWNLSSNSNAISLLEKNIENISWICLSHNLNAIHLLEQNQDKLNWYWLSGNPNAIHLLEQNQNKINWCMFSKNPNIFTYDYPAMKQSMINSKFFKKFQEYYCHPIRVCYYLKHYNYHILEEEIWEQDGSF